MGPWPAVAGHQNLADDFSDRTLQQHLILVSKIQIVRMSKIGCNLRVWPPNPARQCDVILRNSTDYFSATLLPCLVTLGLDITLLRTALHGHRQRLLLPWARVSAVHAVGSLQLARVLAWVDEFVASKRLRP